jgi:hypothetical protein
MYADDDRKVVFYQFPIGMLTANQHAIFLSDGDFSTDGTKKALPCGGAIYVVHVRRKWDHTRFPISNPSKSVPDKNNPVVNDLDEDTEFNKAQAAWDMLRKQPLYMKATTAVYPRRKLIYIDAILLQRLAHTIRRNHPASNNVPPVGSPVAAPNVIPMLNNAQQQKNRNPLLPLKELVGSLSPPKNGDENGKWVLAKNIGSPKASTLRTRRGSRKTESIDLKDGSVLGRDPQGRIWWKSEENSQKVFYLRETLTKPATGQTKPATGSSKKT